MDLKRTCFLAVIMAFAALGTNSCSQDDVHSAGDSASEQDPANPGNPDDPQGYQCGNNQVVCDGVCVHLEDDVDHCGACGNKCADSLGEHTAEWICRKNTCVAQACRAHYHLLDGACVEDDVTHCAGTDCTALPGWLSGYCDEGGQCVAESCLEGYQLNTDDTPLCEEYVQDCDGDASVCDLRTGAVEMACVEGKCAVSKCDMDHYHWNEEQTLCIPNSIHECGAPSVDCTNYAGWNPEDEDSHCDLNEDGVVTCIAASCLSGYHVYGGPNAPCEPDDHENCGEHGHACAENQVCLDGGCTIGCADGLKDCDGVCVDLASNADHCGGCGVACSPDAFEGSAKMVCIGGACNVSVCKEGYHLYDNMCEKDDVVNCGAHNKICSTPDTDVLMCEQGQCVVSKCKAGFHIYLNACEPDSTFNCGAHEIACAGSMICSNGACVCQSGMTQCGSSCVDIKTNNNHCGGCNNKCSSNKICSAGVCKCASGTDCGGICVDTKTDNNHCGACGNHCSSGQYCIAGSCKCPGSMTYCGGKCVDIYSDVNNCGACNHSCSSDQYCIGGSCQCTAGKQFCGGKCVDVFGSDSNNCGWCGNKCGTNQTCEYGMCKEKCPAGTTGSGCSICASGYSQCGYYNGKPLCLDMKPPSGKVSISAIYCEEYCNQSPHWLQTGSNQYYVTRCESGQKCYLNSYSSGQNVICSW